VTPGSRRGDAGMAHPGWASSLRGDAGGGGGAARRAGGRLAGGAADARRGLLVRKEALGARRALGGAGAARIRACSEE